MSTTDGMNRYWSDELRCWQLARSPEEAAERIAATLRARTEPTPKQVAAANGLRRAGEASRRRVA